MSRVKIITGNHAAAYACMHAKVGVVAAYPITPQSPVVEKISQFVEKGLLPNTQFVMVESEQSAIAAVIAASATGSRVFTASSANGIMYMAELLPWAAGNRLPVVMCDVTRALGAPWSVWSEHGDIFTVRDCGWITMFSEDNQEIYDTTLLAYRIAEDPSVYLPAFNAFDGYILSHTIMPVKLEDQETVDQFLPPLRHHINLADFNNVKGVSPVTIPNTIDRGKLGVAPGYYEFRFSMQRALEKSISTIKKANKEFSEVFGRSYGNGLYKKYKMDDAEVAILAAMSVAAESRLAVDELREKGIKAGLVSLKTFRPFPGKELQKVFKDIANVVVFERAVGYGFIGAIEAELRASLYKSTAQPDIKGYVLGLGGRDIKRAQIVYGVEKALKSKPMKDRDIKVEFLGMELDNLAALKKNNDKKKET
ncbi:MAG: pyruvate ferredoxin oxidoreductase [Candidatus Lokiarchaeota archaeon]|nr:pyruvate ferredoxin oxidoreductase [Candidatus Lokiarchaeota archaeon]